MNQNYVSRGFAPVDSETSFERLDIEGKWPAEVRGTLYRIGPNPQFKPIEPYNPLLGDGMIHAFRISKHGIAYRNRWIRTQQWQLENEAGRALFATSGNPTHHDPSVRSKLTDGVANTSLCWHGGKLLALEEGHPPIEVDPSTLHTRGAWSFGGRLPGNMTAHPKLDPETGELILFANDPHRKLDGEIEWYVVDRDGMLIEQHSFTAPFASVVHDFAVTRDFLIFVICPVTISIQRAREGGPALAWEPDKDTHIGVASRKQAADVRWFGAPARFVWHTLNSWNEGSRITLDLCEQATPAFPAADGSVSSDESAWCQRLSRWQLDWAGSRGVRTDTLSDEVCEYPRIDERDATKRTRHGYFACHGGPGTGDPFHRGIAHFDFDRSQMSTFFFGNSRAVSEPVFIPTTRSSADGAGYLICLVYEEATDRSHIALLDARSVEDGPVAIARLEHRVPMGFHGVWLSA